MSDVSTPGTRSPENQVMCAARTAPVFVLVLIALLGAQSALADSKESIESKSTQAIAHLIEHSPESKELLEKAKGVLIFPHIVKMGFGVGAQYGEGVLRVSGASVGYYSTAGASFGVQLGAQTKSEAVLFMSDDALSKFQAGQGWEVGVDSSVAVVKHGKGGKIDSSQWNQPVLAFIFSNKGLMGNLSLEGSKITRIAR